MSKDRKDNIWYWLGNTAVGLLGIGITFSDKIFSQLPEHTTLHQWGWLIAPSLKFIYDSFKYRKGTIASSGKRLYDILPNGITGEYNSNEIKILDNIKKKLPGGLSFTRKTKKEK